MANADAAPDRPARPSAVARLCAAIALIAGLAWTLLLRVPVVTNARRHLDSDLAVDGLTLIDALAGNWRWHYPGTPHMGSAQLLLSYVQARVWGPTPEALVSGGLVAWALVVLACFALAYEGWGPRIAAFSLVPLVFGSTGLIWLSGRITGGHLMTLAWHAGALLGLLACLRRARAPRYAALGLWCGLGVWLDAMFAFTLLALLPPLLFHRPTAGPFGRKLAQLLLFAAMIAVGALPKLAGRVADPYDAYNEQFAPVTRIDLLAGHARMLGAECLPRLVAGHRLPDARQYLGVRGRVSRPHPLDQPTAWIAVGSFVLAIGALLVHVARPGDPAGRQVAGASLVSALLVTLAFVVNRNIYDSDNYRYLIYWCVPWALGFGLLIDGLVRARGARRLLGLALAASLAGFQTIDTALWYRQNDWVDRFLQPVRPMARAMGHGPESFPEYPGITHVFGPYWDVYRLSFLTGARVVAIPTPQYPDRFPGWSRRLDPSTAFVGVGRGVPDWRGLWAAAWAKDGGDPDDLPRVRIENFEDRARGLAP